MSKTANNLDLTYSSHIFATHTLGDFCLFFASIFIFNYLRWQKKTKLKVN